MCPIREQAGDAQYNSAVIIDRSGHVIPALSGEMAYRKVYPVLGVNPGPDGGAPLLGGGEPGTHPGPSGVQAWDLDFGRVAILICMDINFPEVWHEAYALGAEVVLWPTTMTTPNFDSQSFARLYRYNVVAGGRPGDIVDVLGRSFNAAQVCHNASSAAAAGFCILNATLDLDRVFMHECCGTCAPLLAALAKHPELELELHGCGYKYGTPDAVGYMTEQAVMLLRSKEPSSVSARQVMQDAGVLSLREILTLSRQGLNSLRQHGQPIPNTTQDNHVLVT